MDELLGHFEITLLSDVKMFDAPLGNVGGSVVVTEARTVIVQSEPAINVHPPRQDAIASFVGVSVLVYVLLLCALAPRNGTTERYSASL